MKLRSGLVTLPSPPAQTPDLERQGDDAASMIVNNHGVVELPEDRNEGTAADCSVSQASSEVLPPLVEPAIVKEYYWPTVKAHIINPQPQVHIQPTCIIDDYPLAIAGTFPLQHLKYATQAHGHAGNLPVMEEAAILPCGHLIGYECLLEWYDHRAEVQLNACCPLCNFNVTCEACQRPMPIVRAPIRTEDLIRHWPPPTMPQGGAFSYRSCADCAAKDFFAASIRARDFPKDLVDMNPALVQLTYNLIDELELKMLNAEPQMEQVVDEFARSLKREWSTLREVRRLWVDDTRMMMQMVYPWS